MKKFILSFALVVLFTPLAHAKRVALVVGNASYVHEKKLKNPVNDARLLEATFKNKPLAFDQVIYLQDANRAELLKTLARFKQAAQGAEIAVVYYSGHGMSNSKRSNYLLPVDMPAIASDASQDVDVALKTSAVSEDELIEAVEDAKVQLVILDACRDNGFLPKAKSGSKGLGRTTVDYTDRLLAYATEAGRTAEDGKGNNSTYAGSLARNLQRTELPLLAALDQVAEDVAAATQGVQRPTRSGSLRTGVFIVPGVSGGVLTRDQVLFAQLSSRLAQGDARALAELEALPLYQEMRKKLGLSGPLRAPEASRAPAANGGVDGKVDAQMSPDRQTIAQVVIQSQSSDASERALAEAMAIYLQERSNRKSKLQELAEQGNDMAAMMLERTLRMGLSGPADSAGAARWKAQAEKAQSALALLEQKNSPLILSWLGNKYRDSEYSADWPKAAAYFERAAAFGYPYAHLVLGYLYQQGRGVAKNEVLAADRFRKSAEAGSADGMNSLGIALRDGRGVAKDEAQAGSWFLKSAEAGNLSGMVNIGYLLYTGRGVTKDEAQAVIWFRQAAEAGDTYGMNSLGAALRSGQGVPKDDTVAVSWFRKAADAGNLAAMVNLARLLRDGRSVNKDMAQAINWFQKAADGGDGDAMHELGVLYQHGRGVKREEDTAFAWYLRSAKAGFAEGKFSVGWMLENGVGVAKDEEQALRWYREAAEGGSSGGMHNLGAMLAAGKGVTKDEAQAVAWYRKAADLGNKKAMLSLGFAVENGEGTTKDEAQAVNWYRKAAEAGDASGMAYFATMLRDGKGVAKDESQAANWFRKAADAGDVFAMTSLGAMLASGKGISKDETEAVNWYRKAAEAEDASGMAYFGRSLRDGKGVEKDEAGGTRWIMKAAEMGDSYGMGLLGWSYDTGTGISKDKSMAAHWYKKAADAGNEWAKKQLQSAASR